MNNKISRKDFFKDLFQVLWNRSTEILQKSSGSKRPPGAVQDESAFLNLCSGCDACMAACPMNIIVIDDLERRDPLILSNQKCIHCPGYPCIASCPTGALSKENGTRLRVIA